MCDVTAIYCKHKIENVVQNKKGKTQLENVLQKKTDDLISGRYDGLSKDVQSPEAGTCSVRLRVRPLFGGVGELTVSRRCHPWWWLIKS